MPIPQNVARKLREVLGADAAEDLVSWMDETSSVRADVAELRHEMQVGFVRLEQTFSAQLERFRADLVQQMERNRADLVAQMERQRSELLGQIERQRSDLGGQIERSRSDMIKWSFVFWAGAVTAVAALAGLLR